MTANRPIRDNVLNDGQVGCGFWPSMNEAERIAKRFLDTYERLAPLYGYKTRPRTAVRWDELPADNRDLMIATVATAVLPEIDRLRGALERILAEHVSEGGPDRAAEHCAICSPQERRWPCVTVLEARAALGVEAR